MPSLSALVSTCMLIRVVGLFIQTYTDTGQICNLHEISMQFPFKWTFLRSQN